jgi:hypothetical protein
MMTGKSFPLMVFIPGKESMHFKSILDYYANKTRRLAKATRRVLFFNPDL